MEKIFLTTKEVAEFLHVNEKMVYTLVAEKGLPATKVTGKWLFPQYLVVQWMENNTRNFPDHGESLSAYSELLLIAGSNDILLDKTLSLFNSSKEYVAMFGNLGSMGGLHALRRKLCHLASSHLMQDDEKEYNFDFALQAMDSMPVIVNFCRREQGLLLPPSNPQNIKEVADLGRKGLRLINRSLGTGTRLLLDKELKKVGISGEKIQGYEHEVSRHLDVGLEILAGRADVGPGIKAVAAVLGLDFCPLRWERFDLVVDKDCFFDKGVQSFLGLLNEDAFKRLAVETPGYDISLSGKMVFPENVIKK